MLISYLLLNPCDTLNANIPWENCLSYYTIELCPSWYRGKIFCATLADMSVCMSAHLVLMTGTASSFIKFWWNFTRAFSFMVNLRSRSKWPLPYLFDNTSTQNINDSWIEIPTSAVSLLLCHCCCAYCRTNMVYCKYK